MKPASITVLSSESPFFLAPNQNYEYAQFERIAFYASLDYRGSAAGHQTEVVVTFSSGQELSLTLFLSPHSYRGIRQSIEFLVWRVETGKAEIIEGSLTSFLELFKSIQWPGTSTNHSH